MEGGGGLCLSSYSSSTRRCLKTTYACYNCRRALKGRLCSKSMSDLSRPWKSPGRIYEERLDVWLVNQHWIWWRGLGDTQRQTRELISGPCLGAKASILSFSRTLSRAVTGLLTGHNTPRRHLHLIGLSGSPLCRKCGAEDETSVHILCECEAMASLRYAYLGSFLEPENIKSISLGAIWIFIKATGLS